VVGLLGDLARADGCRSGMKSNLRSRCGCALAHSPAGVDVGRRGWLGRVAAVGATALAGCAVPSVRLLPLASVEKDERIDVHHHLSPPAWLRAMRQTGQPLAGLAESWTPEGSLADMDRAGIRTAMLSITQPGIFFPGRDLEMGRRVARESNEYGARLVADHNGRFGLFASLPLTDIDGSLRAIEHAFDDVKADGICLMTSYGDTWLGDASFTPVMEELDRRKAVIYTHPTSANCCTKLQPGIPPTMIEFGTDTTRAIASVLFSGTAARFPNIRWIFSHAGGTMPYLIERFTRQASVDPRSALLMPKGVEAHIADFYYDTAQSSNAATMTALSKVVPASQIVLGSDFPYRSALATVQGLRSSGAFTSEELQRIERGTAALLFPAIPRSG